MDIQFRRAGHSFTAAAMNEIYMQRFGVSIMDYTPTWPLLTAFLFASFLLAITPGPGVFYIVTRSLSQGRRAGLASVAGVALGNLGNSIGAAVGLAALFSVSALAFHIVKYAGAAYLVFLGLKALLRPSTVSLTAAFESSHPKRIFRDGFVVALLNPKTALFFSAFLPQFIDTRSSTLFQTLTLGTVFVLIASITDTVSAIAASAIAPKLTRAKSWLFLSRYLTASAFIGLGVFTAVSDSRLRR